MTFDPAIIRRDSGQGVFQQSFIQFASRMTAAGRYQNGLKQLKANAALLSRIEQRTGVPPPVVVALWGLESDYGAYKGGIYKIIRSVATLAYDCRRSEFFRDQLMGAVRIVERGDLRPDEMIGNWAGELGPTQFTPADYFKHGIDFDGDGRVDMVHSVPDALASAANLMKSFGWQKGQPWLQEVRVPAEMPWQESGLDNQHPRSQWAKWGVTAAHGQLPADNLPASLILPMGRLGPAFLAYPNFKAYIEWNAAIVYSTTAAYFGTRLAGAPPFGPGNGQPVVPTTRANPGTAAAADRPPDADRRGRRPARLRHPRRGQAGPAQGRPAGGCLSDPGADRAAAGRAVARLAGTRRAPVNCGINARSTISWPNSGR